MAVSVDVVTEKLPAVLRQLNMLIAWLKPGRLAMKVAGYKAVVEPASKEYSKQSEALIDSFVQTETVDGEKRRKRKPHKNHDFLEVWDFGANEAEWEQRNKELGEGITTLSVSSLLTPTDIEKFEKDRITSKDAEVVGVDFSVLLPLMESQDEPAGPADDGGDA